MIFQHLTRRTVAVLAIAAAGLTMGACTTEVTGQASRATEAGQGSSGSGSSGSSGQGSSSGSGASGSSGSASSSSAGSAGTGVKPSYSEFSDHMYDLLSSADVAGGIPEEQLVAYSDCISTELYYNLDPYAVNEVMNLEDINDLGDFSSEDQEIADAAAETCVAEITGE